MVDDIEFKIDHFDQMYNVAKKIFSENLRAIFVHGSLFDGTFGKYSDYDIVIVSKTLPESVLDRDQYAQKLKQEMNVFWGNNPYSFDFVTESELFDSAKKGHPFLYSVLKKGSPVYDPHGLFSLSKYQFNDNISDGTKRQMYDNFIHLSSTHHKNAEKLHLNDEFSSLSMSEASRALTMLLKAKLLKKNKYIYKGEIYQYFIREYHDRLDTKSLSLIWRYGFHANQILNRLQDPHVDMPLQSSFDNEKLISKYNYTEQLNRLYDLILPL